MADTQMIEAPEQDTDIGGGTPIPPDDPRKKLWQALYSNKDYTKSYDDFTKQFSSPESIKKLHDALASNGDYTKGMDAFQNQFFPTSKKKDAGTTSLPTTTSNGNGLQSKDADLYKTDPEAYFAKWGLHPMQLEQDTDPLNSALVVANEKLNIARSDTDPISRLQKTKQATQEINKVKNGFNGDGTIAKPILDNLIGDNTEKYSDEQLQQKTPNTLTGQKALQAVIDQRKVQDAISTTTDLYKAATKYSTGKENEMQGDEPEAKVGQYVQQFLNNPNVISLSKQDQNFSTKYKEAEFNWYNDFPSAASKDISQKIGQKLEDSGQTNWLYNNPGKDKVDNAVDNMVKNGEMNQHEKYIYQKNIRPDLGTIKSLWQGSPIPTADLLNSISKGITEGGKDVASSIRDITDKLSGGTISALGESPEDRTKRLQQEEAATANIDPKGALHKFVSGGGRFLGFATPMILGEMAGLPTEATMVAQFEGQNADKSRELFPKNEALQNLYTIAGTTMDAFLGKALPIGQASESIKNILGKEVQGTVEDYAAGKITGDESKNLLFNRVNDFAESFGKNTAQTGGIVTGYQLLHNGLDAAFGKRDFKVGHEAAEALGNLPQNIVNSAFLGGLAASGKLISPENIPNEKGQPDTRGNLGEQPTDEKVRQESIVPHSENIQTEKNYRTMDMGSDEGKEETKDARKLMKERFSDGDIKMDGDDGKGETGKEFAARAITQWENDKTTQPNNTTIITHSSVLKAIKAYEDMKDKPSDPNNFSPEQWKEFSDNYNKESTDNGDLETFKGTNGDIHVIRHGQTEDNEQNKFRSGNTNLTEKGIEQTKQSGQELNQKTGGDVPKIISSDLPRAIRSSNIINEELGKTETPEVKNPDELFNEKLSFDQKYKKVDFEDEQTGETKKISAISARNLIEKRHNILEKLVNCLT